MLLVRTVETAVHGYFKNEMFIPENLKRLLFFPFSKLTRHVVFVLEIKSIARFLNIISLLTIRKCVKAQIKKAEKRQV